MRNFLMEQQAEIYDQTGEKVDLIELKKRVYDEIMDFLTHYDLQDAILVTEVPSKAVELYKLILTDDEEALLWIENEFNASF